MTLKPSFFDGFRIWFNIFKQDKYLRNINGMSASTSWKSPASTSFVKDSASLACGIDKEENPVFYSLQRWTGTLRGLAHAVYVELPFADNFVLQKNMSLG